MCPIVRFLKEVMHAPRPRHKNMEKELKIADKFALQESATSLHLRHILCIKPALQMAGSRMSMFANVLGALLVLQQGAKVSSGP